VLTVITATKNKEFELAFATIYASQIINIQFALVFPWTLKCLYDGNFNLQGAKMFDSLIMVLFVLASTVVCLIWFRFKLNLNLFAALVTIYFGYVIFEYRKQYG
jgi:Ca2+/Na+ antiporter